MVLMFPSFSFILRHLEWSSFQILEKVNVTVYGKLHIFIMYHTTLKATEKFRVLRLKNEQLAQYADEVDSLGTRVSSAESVRENLLTQLDVHKAKEKELKELLENRFSEVRELLRTYYEFGNSKKLQKTILRLLSRW